MQRQPAVAGQFYPGNEEQLRAELSRLIPENHCKKKVKGIISPHAGYVYSGSIAGTVYSQVEIPATVLVIGPNHHGAGAAAALYPDGEWLTPLGTLPISSRLNSLLLRHVPFIQSDAIAHRQEHSLEVQIPFLQYLRPDVSISALCLGRSDFTALRQIASGVAAAISEYAEDVLIVASSDMTHYESAESARLKDAAALERVLALDAVGLLDICSSKRITMCGVAPSAVMMEASIELGATEADLVAYGNSGDITGDSRQVVGYAAVVVY
jgi:AmmeMemoRadiSam system protein B